MAVELRRSTRNLAVVVLALPRTRRRRRFAQLLGGLFVFGVGLALMVRAELGLGPWDVLHQGISRRTGIPIGAMNILLGVLVMVAWVPLRRHVGIGTVANTILVGLTLDLALLVLPHVDGAAARGATLLVGVGAVAAGTALYIGAGLGTGPRDGLMTGLSDRTGVSLRAVRTSIEVAVLSLGWLLGGDVGAGTVLFAFAIGPLFQYGLGRVTIPASPPIE